MRNTPTNRKRNTQYAMCKINYNLSDIKYTPTLKHHLIVPIL